MEVVNVKKSYTLNTNLHSQNNNPDDTCNFENRMDPEFSTLKKILVKKKYSKNFYTEKDLNNISEDTDINPSNIKSHYNILVNNTNTQNDPSLINISDSYNVRDNKVNFNYKNYNDEDYDINTMFLSSNDQVTKSITNNDIYKTKDFWVNQYPEITNSEYLYRDVAEDKYNDLYKSQEQFVLPKNTPRDMYNKKSTITTEIEPKVASQYTTNYTSVGDSIVHEGKPKGKGIPSFRKNLNYDSDLRMGTIKYYNDDANTKYNDEFGITRNLVQTSDGDGTSYNKYVNNNVKNTNLSKHEQNIMLRRNDQILASMDYTMRND
jgi:hypothetical protein